MKMITGMIVACVAVVMVVLGAILEYDLAVALGIVIACVTLQTTKIE